uniref:BHLH domain-containing protein n=1 Tax=Myripristis murdjan TaxID=586833 RepID=A0A667WKT7_9TELE
AAKLNSKDETASFLKSQVEKRRRERMNCSLERLRSMLLQESQQPDVTHRVEKAEILEHTVLFLQKTAIGDTKTAAGGGQQHSFQDGFSTCLQRAACFLGPQGKGLRLAATLDATFAARFPLSDSGGIKAAAKVHSSSSLPHTNFSQLSPQTMKQKSKLRLNVHAFSRNTVVHSQQLPLHHWYPRVPQQPQRPNQLEIRVERRASKQSPSRSPPVSQSLWRPWP